MSNASKFPGDHIKRVGLVFSGGPAPGANAVISAAATSFLEDGREVVGFFHGYSSLQDYHPVSRRLLPDRHYRVFREEDLRGLRNARGIVIGTARSNPGEKIKAAADLDDHEKTGKLHNVYTALVDLEIDALISIGGDDTLKTANFLYLYQQKLPASAKRVRIVHVPKTIDNDYRGIDFTFGFFTAVDVMAKELQNLRADALATSSYFIVETMGRKAGWLAYGVAIAGEAHLVIATEDIRGPLTIKEKFKDPDTGEERLRDRLNVPGLADYIVDTILARETRHKHYGTIVLAEGLSEMLPEDYVLGVGRDEHGHLSLGKVDLAKMMAEITQERYAARTGKSQKVTGVQLGYESRCAPPHAFDVMLGSQLGIGSYRALVEEGLDGHMVSTEGQLELTYVAFEKLIDKNTLRTEVRFIHPGSDFHRLARFLETRVDQERWNLGRNEP